MKTKYIKPETSTLRLRSSEKCLAASVPVVKPENEEGNEGDNGQLNYGGYGNGGSGLSKPNGLWEDTDR